LAGILLFIGMLKHIEQSIVKDMKDNLLKGNIPLLFEPFVFVCTPIEVGHNPFIS